MTEDFKILEPYGPLFHSKKTYYLISGGRASGKSTQVAMYFIIKLFGDEYFRGVISRYTAKSLTHSILQDILDLLDQLNLKPLLQISGDTIAHPNGNMIITHAMKIAEGSMTAKSKGLASVTHLLIDEATEVNSEEEYIKLIDSFRTRGVERKIFLCFNPTSKDHWIFRRFYNPDGSPNSKWYADHCFIHTTYLCNAANIDPLKIEEWERMRDIDPEYYNHHILGQWSELNEGAVYKNWSFDFAPDPEAERLIGMDFGYSNDPTAVIEVRRKSNRLWIRELLYQTGMTNTDIIEALGLLGISKKDYILADSAEPKSIEEVRRAGYNIHPAVKGPDSVRHGIQKVSSYEVYCHPHSENLKHEYMNYVYRTGTNTPKDENNHLLDALRYALSREKPSGKYAIIKKPMGRMTNNSNPDRLYSEDGLYS
jgi:phage terminase large subunit